MSMLAPAPVEVSIEEKLPQPKSFYLLIRMIKTVTKIGSIHLPDGRSNDENLAGQIGEVVLMGPAAYTDMSKFPNGPSCDIGEYVFVGSYVGIRFNVGLGVEPVEYRLVCDDDVKAVVPDPTWIRRNL